MTDKSHVPDSSLTPSKSALAFPAKKSKSLQGSSNDLTDRKVKFGDVAIRQYFVDHGSDDDSVVPEADDDLSLSSLSLGDGKDVDGINRIRARRGSVDPDTKLGIGGKGIGGTPGNVTPPKGGTGGTAASGLGPPLAKKSGADDEDDDGDDDGDENYEEELQKEVIALRQELEVKMSRSNSSGSGS